MYLLLGTEIFTWKNWTLPIWNKQQAQKLTYFKVQSFTDLQFAPLRTQMGIPYYN